MAGVRLTSAVLEIHSLDSGSTFVDVSADVRHGADIEWEYGIRSSDITTRAATSGIARFKLDNSVNNASAIRGWYSPDSGSTREGFIVGAKTRITLNYAGSPFYKYVGFVDQIRPAPGIRMSQDVAVTAADYMDALARFRINAAVPTQTNVTADIAASAILNVIEQQPEAIAFSTGQDTLTFALDTGAANKTTALREMQKLSLSELGRLYQRGDASTGGVLVFEDRHFRILKTSSEASLNNTMVDMIIGRDRRRVKNKIRTRTHPRVVDGSASDLFTLDFVPEIRGGASLLITGEYTDPTNANRKVGGASVIVPASTTDFTMNSQADGGGANLTSDFTVTASLGGYATEFNIVNDGVTAGFVTFLQVRGIRIKDFQPVLQESSDATSITSHGELELIYDMPYQENPLVGKDAADFFLTNLKDPVTNIEKIRFIANESDAQMLAALQVEPGDRVTIDETITGISTDFFVNGVRYRLKPTNILECTWHVEPAQNVLFWAIGEAGFSEIGLTTPVTY